MALSRNKNSFFTSDDKVVHHYHHEANGEDFIVDYQDAKLELIEKQYAAISESFEKSMASDCIMFLRDVQRGDITDENDPVKFFRKVDDALNHINRFYREFIAYKNHAEYISQHNPHVSDYVESMANSLKTCKASDSSKGSENLASIQKNIKKLRTVFKTTQTVLDAIVATQKAGLAEACIDKFKQLRHAIATPNKN